MHVRMHAGEAWGLQRAHAHAQVLPSCTQGQPRHAYQSRRPRPAHARAPQFSFDGDRHLTPWLSIIGKHAPLPPYVEVELVRTGNTIKSGRRMPGPSRLHAPVCALASSMASRPPQATRLACVDRPRVGSLAPAVAPPRGEGVGAGARVRERCHPFSAVAALAPSCACLPQCAHLCLR